MVGLEGIEPPTNGLGNRCSILLSYRPTRTYDAASIPLWGLLRGHFTFSVLLRAPTPSLP